jgi:hypothetical protein
MPFCVANKMEIKFQPLDVSNTVWELESSRADCHTHTHIETDQGSHATPKKAYRFFPRDKLAGAWRKILNELVTGIKESVEVHIHWTSLQSVKFTFLLYYNCLKQQLDISCKTSYIGVL